MSDKVASPLGGGGVVVEVDVVVVVVVVVEVVVVVVVETTSSSQVPGVVVSVARHLFPFPLHSLSLEHALYGDLVHCSWPEVVVLQSLCVMQLRFVSC